jgi:ubiquinone/menaquinone biosynthesis C-methylase UbiE
MYRFYDQHVLPLAIDFVCGLPSFEQGRKQLIPQASGRVLEIGMGTGRNLPFYRADQLESLHGIDPGLHPKAERRAKEAGIDVTLIPLSAERIPAQDASFDCVVSTYTLCTIPDAHAALKEVHRVLAPGGRLLFLEHGLAPDPSVSKWQNRITPYWRPLAGGCHLNRHLPSLIESAGFTLTDLEQGYQSGPRLLSYVFCGTALKV